MRKQSLIGLLVILLSLLSGAASTAFAGTWSLKSTNAGYGYYFNNANGYFFALDNGPAYGGVGGRVKWSTDLVSWTTLQTEPYAETGYGVVYGNSRYVLASGKNGNTGHVVYSANPSSTAWSTGATVAPGTPAGNAGDEFYSVAYNGSTFVAGSANGYMFRSTDGASWTSQGVLGGILGHTRAYNLAYGNGKWVGVGDGHAHLSTDDGLSWTAYDGKVPNCYWIIYANSLFVTIGTGGTIYTSPDGINWTSRTSSTSVDLQGLAYGNGEFVVAGNGGTVLTSPDGINWSSENSGTTEDLYGVAFGNGFFAVSSVSGAYYKRDNTPTVTGISPTSGSIGGSTSVTITGTNFVGVTGVTIGGTAATGITVVSPTSITATTPAGTAGAQNVVVTTLSGTGTGTGLYTYIQPPTVTTGSAGSITTTGATLNGTVNVNNNSTTVTFDYGTTTGYGTNVAATPSTVTGSSNTSVSASISGLTCNTLYNFRVKGVNGGGTSNGNDATFTTGSCDSTPPTISSGTLAASNGYVDINFSEGVYGANNGTTPLSTAKLALTFTQNGGNATNSVISSVKKNDNAAEGFASALTGGETTVRVFLSTTGTPSGVETIEIKPANGASVYDAAGNAMLAAQTTGVKTLNDKLAPTVISAVRTDSTHITVTLSQDSINLTKANDGGFTVSETGVPGTTYAVSAIAQGADASHVVLTVADMEISAKEGVTVKYTSGGNGTVQDTNANAMATDGTGVVVAAWDTTLPSITSATLALTNGYVDIVFSEGVYGADSGTTGVAPSGLALVFTRNGGTATSVVISSVKKNDSAVEGSASALAGGETTIRVFLSITGLPNAVETIEIVPTSSTSIFDRAGNGASASDTTGAKLLNDNTGPAVSSVSVPANATYIAGQNLDFIVNWNENVDVSGTDSTLGLTIGSTSRLAAYLSNAGAGITYRYTVQSGDNDTDGIFVGGLTLNSTTIEDAADNDANLTLNSVGPTAAVLVDTVVPVLTSPTTANIGANIATLSLKSDSTGRGYFTVLTGSGTACGTGAQVKNGQDATSASAFRYGSLTLAANTTGSYTVRNLVQNTSYTVCFTSDDGANLQPTPVTVDFTTAAAVTYATPGWTTVGSAGFSADAVEYTSLSFAPDGAPYVAYRDVGNGNRATVMKYSSGAWTTVGSAGFSAGQVVRTSLSFAPDGTPYVAYAESDNGGKATVMKYSSGAWTTVGSARFSAGYADFTSLSFAPDGTPYVAFRDSSAGGKATVMKLSSGAWTTVGSAGFSLQASYISLSFAPDGTPCVAYMGNNEYDEATVMMYSSGVWTTVGSANFSAGAVSFTSLSFAPDGTPYVAYRDDVFGGKATVMKYSSSAWTTVGSAGFSAGSTNDTSLSFAPDGTPYVAYKDDGYGGKATVMKYSSGAWTTVGSAGFSAGTAYTTSLSFAPDGAPYVAYTDSGNSWKATVMKLSPFPTVTDPNISISGASGTGGAFKIADTVTASWNNSATGDNNSETVTGVTFDFSQFGGGAAVAAAESSGVWTATYTIVAGSIDAAGRNVSVTANNVNGSTTTADTANAVVDNIAPTVTDANISISGASGTGGVFKIGDTVTASWNNTAGGDSNSDTISSVTVDFGQFGGGAAVAATNSSGTWTATHTIVAGVINATNRNVTVTASDNAGNATTTADTTNTTVDNVAPTVTSVGVPSSATYVAGENLDFTVNWSKNVTVTGSASTLGLTIGTSSRTAAYLSKTGMSITYRYTVQSGDNDTDGIAVGSLILNGDTVRDGAGNDADLTLNNVGDTAQVLVEAVPPTATIVVADSYLSAGETSQVTITFSEAVTGFTTADLTVANGIVSGLSSSDGGITWTAILTPAAGITDSSNFIILDNTGVSDVAGNTGIGTTNSNNYAVDKLIATATTLASTQNSSNYGQAVTFTATVTSGATGTVTFSEGPVTYCAVSLSGGQASCTTSSLNGGYRVITATYSGDATYAASSGPTGLSVLPMVSTGHGHTCKVNADGTVACWGLDSAGSLTPPAGALFTQVSNGHSFTCGVKTDGAIACWGNNDSGQISSAPSGIFSTVSAGSKHACGVRADGTVACWGDNTYGQLIPVAGQYAMVTAGGEHSCGIKTDGSIACWGASSRGETTPPSGTYAQLSAGFGHNCAVKSDGTIACWGRYSNGSNPTPPTGTFTQVSEGDLYACGVKIDGTTTCWGDLVNKPAILAAVPADLLSMVSGAYIHACGVKTDGKIICWGQDVWDQLIYIDSPASLPAGTHGAAYPTQTLTADGGVAPYTFSSGSLPPGFTLSSGGLLSGTSSGVDTYSFVVDVADARGISSPRSYSLAVGPADSTTVVASGANPSAYGQSVGFTATVISGSTGTTATDATAYVRFSEGTTEYDCGSFGLVWVAGGQAVCTIPNLSTGTHNITATYYRNGGNYNDSVGTVVQTVNKANSTVSLTLSSGTNPSKHGQSVDFTGTVINEATGTTASNATGMMTFFEGATTLCSSPMHPSGTATCSTTLLGSGPHTITATYSGNDNYNESSAGIALQTVNKADSTTTVTSATNPSGHGQPVAFTATVTSVSTGTTASDASGTVMFKDENNTLYCSLGATVASGQAVCSIPLSAGTHTITATYNGDGNYNGSAGTAATQNVDKANTTTTLAPSASTYGQAVTLTATVMNSGAGTAASDAIGTVTFSEGATIFCNSVAVNAGQAICTMSSLDQGFHRVEATYSGDANYFGSSGTAGQSVSRMVTTGEYHTCMIKADGTVACWGSDGNGQLTVPSGTFAQLSAGRRHTCGLRTDGTVACWGAGTTNTSSFPEYGQSMPPSGNFTQVSAGQYHSCGVKTDGTVACWGANWNGRLTPPAGTFAEVSAGGSHSCGVKTDGSVACWGDDASGQVTNTPIGTNFKEVSAGGQHSCALATTGTVTCWGDNTLSQASLPSGSFTEVSAGGQHTCGVTTDGSVVCWGDNSFGQSTQPAGTFREASAGSRHGCGVRTDGSVFCWGYLSNGQGSPVYIFDPFALEDGSYGSPYSQSYTASGGTAPYTYSIIAGNLPPGLSLSSDGTLSGTPTTEGTLYSFTVEARDSGIAPPFSAAQDYALQIRYNPTTTLTSGTNPSVYGQLFDVTATLTGGMGTPTGTVQFTEGVTSYCMNPLDSNGQALCSIGNWWNMPLAGTHNITATYSGDSTYGVVNRSFTQTVNKADTTAAIVSKSGDTTIAGQNITVNFSVAVTAPGGGTPTGTVTVTDGVDSCTATLDWTLASSCSLAISSAGTRAITATYSGDNNFNASTSAGRSHLALSPFIHVKPAGLTSGGCESWSSACDLQYALGAIPAGSTGVEIWAAAGTYKPTSGTDRTASFELKSGVALYGGFAGTETARSQRDIVANQTILSGDIGVPGDKTDNSYHVVKTIWINGIADLDGLTITGGNANGSFSPNNVGGGMYNNGANYGNSSPRLTNVTFSGNNASLGGGMSNEGYNGIASPILTNVTFTGNSATDAGGGMYNAGGNPVLTNVTFSGNSTMQSGGGMFNNGGNATLTNVTFSNNSAGNGGGMYNYNAGPTLTNCIVWGNTGGQILNQAGTLGIASSVIQDGCPAGSSCTSIILSDPLLGPLGNYGAFGQIIPLLAGSPAIDAGDAASCPATDQRGVARTGACDIGSFESRGFTVTKNGGDNQSATIGTSFASTLSTSVTSPFGEPVNGGRITLTGPLAGAGIVPATATITGGAASFTAVANGLAGGPYSVTVSAAGAANSVNFQLTNTRADQVISVTTHAPLAANFNSGFTVAASGGGASQPVTYGSSGACTNSGATFTMTGSSGICTVHYNQAGDGNYNAAAEVTEITTGQKGDSTTAIALTSGTNPSTSGTVLTFTASITSGATGTVTFAEGSTTYCTSPISNGQAVCNVTAPLSAGAHTIIANYGGDDNFNASSGSVSHFVTPSRLFVKKDGYSSGYCDSWASACELQFALAMPYTGVEIWVAAGTYKPTGSADRTATFGLVNGMSLHGGFAGTETTLAQRDVSANVTILSGDLNGDDNSTISFDEPTRSDNSCHVVTASGTDATALLDGFTVTGGNTQNCQAAGGGGIYINGGSPTLSNMIFSKNSSYYGGAMYALASSGTVASVLTNVTFSGNSSAYYGGAMYSYAENGTFNPSLTNVTFTGNSAAYYGGAMYNAAGDGGLNSPNLVNVTFNQNIMSDYGYGGGMYNIAYANGTFSPSLTNVSFTGNTAIHGGAMFNDAQGGIGSPTFMNTTFSQNRASDGGGAIYNMASGGTNIPVFTNVTFAGNTANSGGAIFNCASGGGTSSPSFTNVTFAENSGNYAGGAIANYLFDGDTGTISPSFTNVTISGNTAGDGPGIFNQSAHPTLANSIVWGNNGWGAQVSDDATSSSTVTYSVIQGGYPGTGNISSDPLLGALGNYGGSTQTLPLLAGSSALDAGTSCPATDQRGTARPQGGGCDIGAYELVPIATTTTVASSANPSLFGASVTLTATVSSSDSGTTPFGTMTFMDNGVPISSCSALALSSGSAGCVLSSLTRGTHSITAAYTGTGGFIGSSSTAVTQTVNMGSQVITFGSLADKTYGDPPFIITADVSSGLGAFFSSLTTPVCTVSGSTVTILRSGLCTIAAEQSGSSDYSPATRVTQSFTVNRATPVISWANPAPISYGTPLSASQLNAAANVDGSFVYTPAAGTVTGPGSQTLAVTFTPTDTTNYAAQGMTVTLTVVPDANYVDTAPPTVDAFTMPSTSTDLTVAVTGITASDNIGVVAYLLSETATQPEANAIAWTTVKPVSHTFVSQGLKTLYAFAKDAAGNISAPAGATVTIGLADTTVPTVDAFTLPATAAGLTVNVSSLIASDDSGVTGYLLSETATQPRADAVLWTTLKPLSYTFASQGIKTLHAFAKDGAGNISVPVSATVAITLADTSVPTVDEFTLPPVALSLTVNVASLIASDNTGINGYLLSENSAQPAADAPLWTTEIPTVYSFASQGVKYLYAFAKDAAGNISVPAAASVTIVLADTTVPVVDEFTLPATASSLTVNVSSFIVSDESGVTAYLLSETASLPQAGDAGWTASRPAAYTFTSQGVKTLYAFAKDAAGNISVAAGASVAITLADTTKPVVDVFTLPASATGQIVTISGFSASDDSGVTGYLLSEADTAPDASAPGWTSTVPTYYSFGSAGSKILYAFARDGAGNISAPAAATVVISLSDTSAPTITAFAMPPVSGSLTVPIITFTAADNTGVSGYLLSEAATAPDPAAPGWRSTPEASFTFAGAGDRIVRAYVKDAAGNISVPVTAQVLITLPVAVTGICGTAHSSVFYSAPTTNLCAAGTPSSMTGIGPWSWICLGANGGTAASCSAALNPVAGYSVTPVAGPGSSIAPDTVQSIDTGNTASFTISANAGYGILGVTGCGGTLDMATYTTAPITGNCSVNVIAVPRNGNGSGVGSEPALIDALRAWQAYRGTVQLTAEELIRYDVAPLSANGIPQGNGIVDFDDVIMILRRTIGIGSW